MDWTFDELIFELGEDPERRIMFVEGIRDLALWWNLLPPMERQNTVVYPAAYLKIDDAEGGYRGRLVRFAEYLRGTDVADRVAFFIDADWDRVLGRECLPSVFMTDGRDIESYAITQQVFRYLMIVGFGKSEQDADGILGCIGDGVRDIAAFRIFSDREGVRLPFSKTLPGRMSRYIDKVSGRTVLKSEKFCSALLQNAGISLSRRDEILGKISGEIRNIGELPDMQVLHGKDLVEILSIKLESHIDEMGRMIFLSICSSVEHLRSFPEISRAETWARDEAA